MGKGSILTSNVNIPGKVAWLTMEVPGMSMLLYTMRTLSTTPFSSPSSLPWQNKVLAALFVTHYSYRAVIYPIIAPSMSPIHIFVWMSAAAFQVCNGSMIGAWLGAYGPTTQAEWQAAGFTKARFFLGCAVWAAGLACNYFSDEELREIRRSEQRRQDKLKKELAGGSEEKKEEGGGGGGGIKRHYELPENGLFRYILYPHYFFEWVEWAGYWIAGGLGFAPARVFLVNEFFSMLPRAVKGGEWYRQKFGREKVDKKWIIIPGIY